MRGLCVLRGAFVDTERSPLLTERTRVTADNQDLRQTDFGKRLASGGGVLRALVSTSDVYLDLINNQANGSSQLKPESHDRELHTACRCGHCKALAPQFQKVAENLQVTSASCSATSTNKYQQSLHAHKKYCKQC